MKIEREEEKQNSQLVPIAWGGGYRQEVVAFQTDHFSENHKVTLRPLVSFSKQVTLSGSSLGENQVILDRKSLSEPSGGTQQVSVVL